MERAVLGCHIGMCHVDQGVRSRTIKLHISADAYVTLVEGEPESP